MQEHEKNEKEIIEGYEIKHTMRIGGKKFAFGIHIDPKHKDKYFEGVITYNDIFANYEGSVWIPKAKRLPPTFMECLISYP